MYDVRGFSCLLQRVPGVGDVGKFLQGQGFAPALAVDTGFFQYLDNLFLAHARILQGIGKGLAALLESGLDDLEEALFIGQIHRRLLADVHGTTADVTSGAGMKHFGEISKSIWGFV